IVGVLIISRDLAKLRFPSPQRGRGVRGEGLKQTYEDRPVFSVFRAGTISVALWLSAACLNISHRSLPLFLKPHLPCEMAIGEDEVERHEKDSRNPPGQPDLQSIPRGCRRIQCKAMFWIRI